MTINRCLIIDYLSFTLIGKHFIMKTTQGNFDHFAQDAQKYVNELAEAVGYPEENTRALILWRAVLHTVRDRIHFGESLDLISSLPMIFKGIFVEDWKYTEKPPLDFDTIDKMKAEVEKRQKHYGEEDFDWDKSTEKLIGIILNSLLKYTPESQFQHVLGQMPKEIKEDLKKT